MPRFSSYKTASIPCNQLINRQMKKLNTDVVPHLKIACADAQIQMVNLMKQRL